MKRTRSDKKKKEERRRRGKMQRRKTPKKVEELSRRAAVCYSFLLPPPPLCPTLRESRCIIHDFVNVACRCIFTALYLEKFRVGETRYRAVSARGVLRRTRVSCVFPIPGEGRAGGAPRIQFEILARIYDTQEDSEERERERETE